MISMNQFSLDNQFSIISHPSHRVEKTGNSTPFLHVGLGGASTPILLSIMLLWALAAGAHQKPVPPHSKDALRVATRVIPPFVYEEKGNLTGFSIELWKKIGAKMGVQTEFQTYPVVADLLGAVKSGKADVGIAAISITADRDREFDFSQPMFDAGLQIMVRGKSGEAGSSNPVRGLFTLLFSPVMLVWLGIVAAMIILPAHIVWFVERNHHDGMIPTKSYFPGIFHAMWWSASTLATQADSMPRAAVARFMAILWMFTSVVFVAYFTAQVTASLTVLQLQGNIKGPDDLPGKRVATTRASTSAAYLRDKHAQVQEFEKIDDAYEALLDDKADAIVFDSPVLLYYASHDGKGKVQVVGGIFRKESYGIVVLPNSPYRKPIDTALLGLKEDGTYQDLYDKWFKSD
jgi:polar amino acid transport system substrate-binding protein